MKSASSDSLTIHHKRSLIRGATIVSISVVVVLILIMLSHYIQMVTDRNARIELSTRMIEQSLTRTIESVETSLLSLSAEVQELSRTGQPYTKLNDQIDQVIRFAPHIRQVLLLQGDRVLAGSSSLPSIKMDLAALAFNEGTPSILNHGLRIGELQMSRFLPIKDAPKRPYKGLGLIPVALTVFPDTGEGAVTLILALNVGYIKVLLAENGSIVPPAQGIYQLNGSLLFGMPITQEKQRTIHFLVNNGLTEYTEDAALYGWPLLRSQFRLSSKYPLVLVQSIDHKDTLRLWLDKNSSLLTLMFLAMLLVAVAVILYYRSTLQKLQLQEEVQLLYKAIEQSPVTMLITDEKRRIEYVNPAFTELFGYTEKEVQGLSPNLLRSGLTPKTTFEDLDRTLKQRDVWQGEFINQSKAGEIIEISCVISSILNQQDQVTHHVGVMTDIRERKRAAEDQRIAATVFDSQEGIIVTDAQGKILKVNNAYTEITGFSEEEVIGSLPQVFDKAYNSEQNVCDLFNVLHLQGSWRGEFFAYLKDGSQQPHWVVVSVVKDEQGQPKNYVCSLIDISERKEAEQQILQLAYFDPLTQLPNRRLFTDRIGRALVHSQRTHKKGALMLIDLDHFKVINDTMGHDVGDGLLKEAADRLSQMVRQGDTVARMGGDEFLVLLEQLDSDLEVAREQAERVAEKIRRALEQTCVIADHQIKVSCSVGVTLFGDRDLPFDSLLKEADIALYSSKDRGRNVISFFSDQMQSTLNSRVSMERSLRVAVESQWLSLEIQPQYSSTMQVVGAEALVRWIEQGKVVFGPDQFIPLAEHSDLIVIIGDWVLDTVCGYLKEWRQKGLLPEGFRMAVNVSAKQLLRPNFVDKVRNILLMHRLSPNWLKLEITENVMINNLSEVIDQMQQLKQLGINFDLDDFGTGFSSLSYLKRLPIDSLKIDRSFVRDIETDPIDASIVSTTIGMAHTLGLHVIAEGVENEAQLNYLQSQGCDSFQGYLLSRPITPFVFQQLLEARGEAPLSNALNE